MKQWKVWNTPGWALITGASAGFGKIFAEKLAELGFNLILVARRKDRLDEIATQLKNKYNVNIETFSADLFNAQDVTKVVELIEKKDNLNLLVNNAGYGFMGTLEETAIQDNLNMIQLHLTVPTQLMHAILPKLKSQNYGGIINIASLASWIPTPRSSMYSATKSGLRILTESVAMELKGTNVKIQVLCPGFTYTEFHDTSTMNGFSRDALPKIMWMDAETVVTISLSALSKNKTVIIPGNLNKFIRYIAESPMFKWIVKKMVQSPSI